MSAIQKVTLTGKRIKELTETGYDRNGNGDTFPYVLVMPEGFNLDDDATYAVVVCGVTDEVAFKMIQDFLETINL